MSRKDTRIYNGSRFKLGLFGFNCSEGITLTSAPERWDASWENNVAAAKLADAAGLEFLLPVARWHGYGGEVDAEGATFETFTWASGLLATTQEIVTFATVHVPLVHPVFAAKQAVTADHIGKGRFGLNVVSGWNASEFEMFGLELREHDERYAYSQEWISIVRRVWSETRPFDFKSRCFDLKGVLSKPKPYGGEHPIIMSAGSSAAGRAFAARHADCLFMAIVSDDTLAQEVHTLHASAAPRPVGVFASGHVFCRRTEKETDEYYHYIVHDMGDWAAAEYAVNARKQGLSMPPEHLAHLQERLVAGAGTFPVVGSPDSVAAKFKQLSEAGLAGMAIGLVDYIKDFPIIRDEVLPRMERLGLRTPKR